MAGIAGDGAHSFKVLLIDRRHHLHHRSRRPLEGRFVCKSLPLVDTFRNMTVDAVEAERRRKHAHRVHELVNRNTFEHLDIRKNLFRHLRALRLAGRSGLGRLSSCERNSQKTGQRSHDHADEDSHRSGFHGSLLCRDV